MMEVGSDNLVPEETKAGVGRLADFEMQAAIEGRGKAIEARNAGRRWMTTSLFALNGGGVLALFGTDHSSILSLMQPMAPFFLGLFFSFSIGLAHTNSDHKLGVQMHYLARYWSEVRSSGQRDLSREAVLSASIEEAKWSRWSSRLFEVAAIASFTTGCLMTVLALHDR